MSKTVTYKNIKNLISHSRHKEISLCDLLRGSFNHKELGWTKFKLRESVNVDHIAEYIGGRGDTVSRISQNLDYNINYDSDNIEKCGILDRMIYDGSEYRNGWHYITGQDFPSEMATIRKVLK